MNEVDFRAATVDMEDTALWDVRRIALQAARRDNETPVRYFEDAVTEALRSLHRILQENLWDELQKHELGKRTLRLLAAEYKPARMVAFEPDDLRRASVRFWEALRAEDEGIREALAAYDYGAASEKLMSLSRTMEREVVARLVYINCPRQNVVEEVVGTLKKCTTNELKMLASKLYDRLDKTGTLSIENREMAKKLPLCKTKEELRVAVRDLLQLFKRKQPSESSNIIGPSIATVTVSYKGQQRQVAAVVRIERLDKIVEESKAEAPPEPPRLSGGGGSEAPSSSSSKMNSVVTVGSDRTIPPTLPNAIKTASEHSVPASFIPSKTPSTVLTNDKEKDWDIPNALPPLRSPKGTTGGSSVLSRGVPLSTRSDVSSGAGAKAAGAPSMAPAGSRQSKATPPASVLSGVPLTEAGSVAKALSSSSSSSSSSFHAPKALTAEGSVRGLMPPGPGSDVGSTKSGFTHKSTSGMSQIVPSSPALAAAHGTPGGAGSDVGSVTRSGVFQRTAMPSGAVVSKGGPGSARSSRSTLMTPDAQNGGGSSSHHVYGSISFDHPGLPLPLPKPLPDDLEDQPGADPWDALNDGGSERSAAPSSSSSLSSVAAAFHAAAARKASSGGSGSGRSSNSQLLPY